MSQVLNGPDNSEQVWCITCGQAIEVIRVGPKPGPVFGPACPCGKSEGITWEKPS